MGVRPNRCRYCARQADVDVRISKRGICQDCAQVRIDANAEAQLNRKGELYEKWANNRELGLQNFRDWMAAIGAPLDDDTYPSSSDK